MRLLEGLYDPLTIQRLKRIGVQSGARCLEVGAGAGSIVRWLAEAVGPGGAVAALDIDPCFLRSTALPKHVEVVEGDIRADCSSIGQFDVVHCRAVLMHMADPIAALRNVIARVAPGGWVVIEDGDLTSVACAVDGHPLGKAWTDRMRARAAALNTRGIVREDWGRRVQVQIAAAGFQHVGGDGLTQIRRGGDEAARWWKSSDRNMDEVFGPTPPFDPAPELIALYDDPDFWFVDLTCFGGWGRKPA